MMTNLPVTLPGYQITEPIYDGVYTLVCRGTRDTDNRSVIIKFLRNEYPTVNELLGFRNQYTIAKHLDLAGIVQPLALETYGNGYAIVMPDEGYISLDQWKLKQFSLSDFLSIAIQLAEILQQLYQNRVIHKDIKPDNILIHPETQNIQLIDFSIASLLPKERQQLANPKVLEGTLAYISPEQTGRMNRGIDYRTDFYSLGVTFYELLTGQLPFQDDNPMGLIHQHMTAQAPAVDEIKGEVPSMVSEIILKLMAKNAEERYQSALGLKQDLEQCVQQWESIGAIPPFELGTQDRSDRFLIPEKLYGREEEVSQLLEAFERVSQGTGEPQGYGDTRTWRHGEGDRGDRTSPSFSPPSSYRSELLLVAGFSGIGKTAVVNEVHKPITQQQGYFIKGKFDQFNRNIPFSAFVQALRDLMKQLLSESDEALENWKEKILHALGDNAQVMIDVIPELERIIGKQPSATELSGSAAQNRFNLIFSKFVQVFATKEHPLVIFLDDLQWVDSASLNLLKLLMNESETGYLLILGAYRDNEVFPAHPLMLTLDKISNQGGTFNTLTLEPLKEIDITQLVADTLLCSPEIATPLSELVYQKTQGNPFFTNQFLKGLQEDGWINFNSELGYWQCDLVSIRQLSLTEDVVEFMVSRLCKLPNATQTVLKLAACIGNQFDLETLAVVCEDKEYSVAIDLWMALKEGLVIPESDTYKFCQGDEREENRDDDVAVSYRFLHDRVQQAAYALIPDDKKNITHLQIGRQLLENTLPSERNHRILDIVNHLNQGQELLNAPEKRLQLAQLNLQAGQKAKEGTAYEAAFNYLSTGLKLLPSKPWEHHYDLTLCLSQEGAFVAILIGEFETMNQWATIAFENVKNYLDCVPFYETQIQAYVAQQRLPEAIQLGIKTLEGLGESFPEHPTPEDFGRGIEVISSSLAERSIEDLIHLPPISDPQALAILKILLRLSSVLVMAAPQLMPLCMFKAVQLSLNCGNSSLSAPAYVTYGMILCGAVGDITTGYRFGKLALQVVDKYQGTSLYPKTLVRFNAGVRHWQESLRNTLDDLGQGYQLALEVGDLESAAICAEVYGYHSYFSGKELQQLEQELKIYSQGIASIQQQTMLCWNETYRQHALNLLGQSDDPCLLVGEAYDETLDLLRQQQYNDGFGLSMVYLLKAITYYLFHQYDQANESFQLTLNYFQSFASFASAPVFYFYRLLNYFALTSTAIPREKEHIPEFITQYRDKLQHWAIHAPMNHQHKVDLIDAEQFRVLGQLYEAGDYYDRAIAGAKAHKYLQEEALANELAAKFYLDWDKEKVASGYMQEAYYCYACWGAKAKIDDLEKCYPQLLQPILSQRNQSSSLINTLTSFDLGKQSIHSLSEEMNTTSKFRSSLQSAATWRTSTQKGMNDILDFASILKASQGISEIMHLDELLKQLTEIILQNSGGDRCALILPNEDGVWELKAMATSDNIKLETEPLADNSNLPVQLIQYVKNTQEKIVIENLDTDLPIIDDYLIREHPQSVFCLPILKQGTVVGILYLQNQSTRGVFTGDRILILIFLCTQAAISLENVRLYSLEQEKTAQLQTSELRLKTLFEKASDSILLLGEQGFIDCNQATLKLFGYSDKSEILSILPAQISPTFQPDGQPSTEKANAMVEKATQSGYHRFEWVYQHSTGNTFWCEVVLTAIPYNHTTILHCLVRDISDRKRLEQEQKRLNDILEAASDYIGLADAQGNILWVNYQLRHLFPEQCGEKFLQFKISDFHPQWVNEILVNQSIPMAIDQGTWLGESAVVDATGREIPVSQLLIAHKSPQGEVEYFSTIMRDISQKKEAEAALIEKSQDLKQALQDLQNTQLQMIQSEKMSALGNLVAGVAHEINNPVGFLQGNIQPAQEYVQDLLGLIDLYQEKMPNPDTDIEEEIEDIDLEFIQEDLPKLLGSMNFGVERIRNISNSLRTFSRTDKENKTQFNIHEGIDSTLLILKHRTKANEQRPNIEIIKEYGDILEVECFPGQLNQVFMNIIANAIDAFEEDNQGKSYQDIEAHPNRIIIRTSKEENRAQIQIQDNGCGMEPEIVERIFDQGFTTKGVGKGTGLGMAIAHQIITEKHGGTISCRSELGKGTTFILKLPL